jgi:hypothetical protein
MLKTLLQRKLRLLLIESAQENARKRERRITAAYTWKMRKERQVFI